MNALGIDISKYDNSFDPSQAVKPIDFVIQRASYGRWRDELFDALLPGVMQVPIRGAYHYLNNWIGWKEQAQTFLDIVRGGEYHFYVADFEEATNTLSTQFARDTYQWIRSVAMLTGKPVLLYTRKGLYDNYIFKSGDNWSVVDYWHAQWTHSTSPILPVGRNTWRIWQYGGESDWGGVGSEYGIGTAWVDVDRYNGTVEQMREWLGLDGSTPPPADVIDAPFPGVTRKRGNDIQVLTIEPDVIDKVDVE